MQLSVSYIHLNINVYLTDNYTYLRIRMDGKSRWHFNPYDPTQPLRQHGNVQEQDFQRSQSLNELQPTEREIVSIMFC